MKVYLRLTEENKQEITAKFGEMCDDVKNVLSSMRSELEDLQNEKQFMKLTTVVQSGFSAFNELFSGQVASEFENWQESPGCFSGITDKADPGNELALENARSLENDMRDIFDEFCANNPLQEEFMQPTSGESDIDSTIFTEQLPEILGNAKESLTETQDNFMSMLNEKVEEDTTFSPLQVLCELICKATVAAMDALVTASAKAAESMEEADSENQQNVEESRQQAGSSITEDDIAMQLSMDNIF